MRRYDTFTYLGFLVSFDTLSSFGLLGHLGAIVTVTS